MREYDDLDDLRAAGHAFVDEALRHLDRPPDAPVETLKTAAELARAFGPPPTAGRPWRDVLVDLRRTVVDESNRLAHPMYMGQQVCPPLPLPALADALVSVMNQSQAVWEMSPAGTMLEHELIRWFARLAFGDGAIGANGANRANRALAAHDGARDALGSFVSGGSAGNLTALLAARARAFPDAWARGAPAGTLLVTGAQAHYSISRSAGILGLGADNVLSVPTNERFATDPRGVAEALAAARAEGRPVLAVVATSGSTATGSFDDLDAIGDTCARHGVWLHVDGAHGASALLSRTHRVRLNGLQRADSLAWDPHKMMFQPLSTAVVLVREQRWLRAAFQQEAPYLFHARVGGASGPAVPDMGSYTFQCSRRSDAIRLWVALEHYGTDRLGELYDRVCALAQHLHGRLAASDDFQPMHEPESNILCFRWTPPGVRDDERLNGLQDRLRAAYVAAGRGYLVNTTMLDGRRELRVTLINPRTTAEHVDRMLEGLRAEARTLANVLE